LRVVSDLSTDTLVSESAISKNRAESYLSEFNKKLPVSVVDDDSNTNIWIKYSPNEKTEKINLDPKLANTFELGGKIYNIIKDKKLSECQVVLPEGLDQNAIGQISYALKLCNYKYGIRDENKTIDDEKVELSCLNMANYDMEGSQEKYWNILADAKIYARDLANGRADTMDTWAFIEEARKIQEQNSSKVTMETIVGDDLLAHNLN